MVTMVGKAQSILRLFTPVEVIDVFSTGERRNGGLVGLIVTAFSSLSVSLTAAFDNESTLFFALLLRKRAKRLFIATNEMHTHRNISSEWGADFSQFLLSERL